ncbi:MAG TPA: tetratricopeptide repeat protein [Thermoplasmata archaeon]|nr:tetratricopeptide repeat protein [Thermoplasmata archaeon]
MSEADQKKDEEPVPGAEEFQKGLSFWDSGNVEEAISEFSKAEELGFKKDAVENNIGAGLERLGRYEDALQHYSEALKDNPRNFFSIKNMAGILLTLGRSKESIPFFARALRAKEDDAQVRVDYFQALVADGRTKKAIKIVDPLLDEAASETWLDVLRVLREFQANDEILDMKDRIPESLAANPEVQLILGEVYYESGLAQEATEQLKKGIEAQSDPVKKSWLGLAMLAEGSEEEGMALLRESMNEGGGDIEVLRNTSFALHGRDRLEEVLDIYEKALRISPEDCVMWNNWGNALYNLGRYKESIPKFVRALEVDPNYEIAWNNIGNALEKMGLFRESLPFHQRAIEINEDFDYAHYAAAVAMIKTGSREQGEAELNRSLKLQPTFPEAWLLKARTMLGSFPEQAIFFASHAVELDPESSEVMMVLAMCQLVNDQNIDAEIALRNARALAEAAGEEGMLREIDEIIRDGIVAVDRMQKADGLSDGESSTGDERSLPEQDSAAWYLLGEENLRKGKKERALGAFRVAYDLDPDSASIISALLMLERDKERLKDHLDSSKDIVLRGLSTPELDKSISEATKRIG